VAVGGIQMASGLDSEIAKRTVSTQQHSLRPGDHLGLIAAK
jgi:hypothetical protein